MNQIRHSAEFRTLNVFYNQILNVWLLREWLASTGNEDTLFRWWRKFRTDGNFSWNIFRIIKYYQINKENIIMIFLRECIGKLNKIRSLFRNFKMKLFYFVEEQKLGHVLCFQEIILIRVVSFNTDEFSCISYWNRWFH